MVRNGATTWCGHVLTRWRSSDVLRPMISQKLCGVDVDASCSIFSALYYSGLFEVRCGLYTMQPPNRAETKLNPITVYSSFSQWPASATDNKIAISVACKICRNIFIHLCWTLQAPSHDLFQMHFYLDSYAQHKMKTYIKKLFSDRHESKLK